MAKDPALEKCFSGIESNLNDGESIIRIRRAEPLLGRPDYFTRYKVDVATLDSAGTTPVGFRSFIVSISSNSGQVTTDASQEIPDI